MSDRKLRAAVIGTGIGRYHMEAYAQGPASELVAVCDLNEPEAREFADKYGATRVTTDFMDLVRMDDLDIVSVATPNDHHGEMSIALLESGKHVLCEKPMTVKLEDAIAMVETADRVGKRLQIDMTLRFLPRYRLMAEMARSGALGQVYAGRGNMNRRKTIPYLDFTTGGEMGRGLWFLSLEEAGGGSLVDIGVHCFDLMWWAMGNPKPLTVTAQLNTSVAFPRLAAADLPQEVDDMAAFWVRFDDGSTGITEVTWDVHMQEASIWRVYGSEGGVELRDNKVIWYHRDGRKDIDSVVQPDTMLELSVFNHFIECIQDPQKEMIASGKECLTVMRVLDAARRSAANGGRETEI